MFVIAPGPLDGCLRSLVMIEYSWFSTGVIVCFLFLERSTKVWIQDWAEIGCGGVPTLTNLNQTGSLNRQTKCKALDDVVDYGSILRPDFLSIYDNFGLDLFDT